jgi:hypothetical protein
MIFFVAFIIAVAFVLVVSFLIVFAVAFDSIIGVFQVHIRCSISMDP